MQAVAHNDSLYATVPDYPSPLCIGVWYRDWSECYFKCLHVIRIADSAHNKVPHKSHNLLRILYG